VSMLNKLMQQKKHILYIITKSNFGGAQKYIYELASAAKDAGNEVSVGCGGTGIAGASLGLLAEKLTADNIPVFHIKNFLRDMSLLSDIKAFVEIWLLIRKLKPDVVHLTSSKAGGIGTLAGRLAFAPRIIFTSHGLTIDEVWRPRWQRVLIYISTWLTLRLADQSILISTETFNRAKDMIGISSHVSLIKNGIAPIKFIERETARKLLAPQVPEQAFWIGGIGELHKNKNWTAVITAMASLPSKAHLLIIGEGEEHLMLEKTINKYNLSERVHLLGYVDGAQYLKAFDIFVLPSKKEGLPYVILEAGLAGVATVASDLPGNRDIIETGQNGILVNPTPQLLATSLEILIRDEGMRRDLALELSETIQTSFSIDNMYQNTFALYASNKS